MHTPFGLHKEHEKTWASERGGELLIDWTVVVKTLVLFGAPAALVLKNGRAVGADEKRKKQQQQPRCCTKTRW